MNEVFIVLISSNPDSLAIPFFVGTEERARVLVEKWGLLFSDQARRKNNGWAWNDSNLMCAVALPFTVGDESKFNHMVDAETKCREIMARVFPERAREGSDSGEAG